MIPRLKELYNKEIKLSLKDKYNFKNLNMAPEVEKIVINMVLGIDGNDAKIVKACEEDLSKITGQKPVVTKFKKSISNFKTRKNKWKQIRQIKVKLKSKLTLKWRSTRNFRVKLGSN